MLVVALGWHHGYDVSLEDDHDSASKDSQNGGAARRHRPRCRCFDDGSGFPLEPVPSYNVHHCMDRDRRRKHRHVDVQCSIRLADDEPESGPTHSIVIVWYSESNTMPNTIVRFDPQTEKFQTWAIPSGGGVVRNVVHTLDGGALWIACSGMNRIGEVQIKGAKISHKN